MVKKTTSFVVVLLLIVLTASSLNGCGGTYFDDSVKRVLPNVNVGGNNLLSLVTGEQITLENAKIRAIFNKDGSVREIVNKESRLYLVKNSTQSDAVRLLKRSETVVGNNAVWEVEENTDSKKSVRFCWQFQQVKAIATVSLQENADEIVFGIRLENNDEKDTVIAVEYPIIDGIDTLNGKEKDYFASPFITGYLFNNPIDNFNENSAGISRSMGMYPNGWNYPMQFSAYYSKNLGGFYWQTKDGGDTVKSFSFIGSNDKLRMSIYHYLGDISSGDKVFDYDIVIANLNKGTWHEAADKYRDWATKQSWTAQKGVLNSRSDYSKALYEDTSLCMFAYRSTDKTWTDSIAIYDMIRSRIKNKLFNISIYNATDYLNVVREYNDLFACFEFPSIALKSTATQEIIDNAMLGYDGLKQEFTIHYYQCASGQNWVRDRIEVDRNYIETYNVDGFYYDVDIAADHPMLCYDTNHAHGNKVNVLSDFYNQFAQSEAMADENGFFNIGQEMITEQLLPYVDYYQARANAGLLGWMEHDRIRELIENGSADKIPLFDYVYHQYGALRIDGYLIPDQDLGQAFYQVAAYTVLNGGIPEFNYEYYLSDKLPSASSINLEMVDFVNRLGTMRCGQGKQYLVYGKMVKPPIVGTSTSEYMYENPNYTPNTCNGLATLGGNIVVRDFVTSAFTSEGKLGVFVCNVSASTKTARFVLQAQRDYGINSGTVSIVGADGTKTKISEIKNGTAKISLSLGSTQVVQLEVTSN